MMKSLLCGPLLAALATPWTAAAASVPSADCAAPPLVETSRISLVGEIHGTVETPAWVAAVACGLSELGDVVLALEIAKAEQPRLDAFMGSEGAAADVTALIAGPFWKGQDGRASEAMLALIERMRTLAAGGAKIRLAAIDDWRAPSSRDAAMAEAIRQVHTDQPGARILALVGNYHARLSPRPLPRHAFDHPAGYFLRDLAPLTVLVEYDAGSAWICAPQCGPLPSKVSSGEPRERGFRSGGSWLPGYRAVVNLGYVTPSVPVSQRAR